MTSYSHTCGGERHVFPDLRALLAEASPRRSGDELAGLAAPSQSRRVAARMALADLPLKTFPAAFAPLASLTIGAFREFLLAETTDAPALTQIAPGLTPEMVADASKLMSNGDLIAVAAKTRVVTAFRTTLGLEGRLASRLQSNHPTDDIAAIARRPTDRENGGRGRRLSTSSPGRDWGRARAPEYSLR